MDRIPPQYDYDNTDEPWLSEFMPITNESSSEGSGELYSTFTTPISPVERTSWYDYVYTNFSPIIYFLLKIKYLIIYFIKFIKQFSVTKILFCVINRFS